MYLSAAGALIEEARQAVIANNLANASTSGYKSDSAVFRQRLTEARENLSRAALPSAVLDSLPGGVFLDGVEFSRQSGPLVHSSNPLDLAMRGDGFFAVSNGSQVLYTRAGSFRRNEIGELVTADGGHKVLGIDGLPIKLGLGDVTVSPRGEIKVDGRVAGRLMLAGSLDPKAFVKVGANNFRYLGSGNPPPATGEVTQGFLESSDVSPVGELVKLIQSHRAYEANMQMARIQDSSLARTVNELGRVIA